MELIKKTIRLITITGKTGCTCTNCINPVFCHSGTMGCTGTCYVIIPDTGVTYCFKILLNQITDDIGFFDAYEVVTGLTGTSINYISYVVTGGCTSRLNELKKYVINVSFLQQYISGGTYVNDGVDYTNSTSGISVTYYLGGIRYIDLLTGYTSGTTFNFTGLGLLNPNFINVPYYKDPNKENIISNPKINDDVFITRQELSAFEKNYRLEYIRNLVDLETYAGGNYFNIINNT